MNEAQDPNRTVDIPSEPADALNAGLAAGFARPAAGPSSVLSRLRDSLGDLRPPLLKEAQGESAHIVQPKSDAMPPPEQTGDRYQLQGEIARGGMGAVLRGRDVDLGRDLAVKVLLEKYVDRPEVARRFIEEAQIGGQLQHPGVVPVYDIGHFGQRPFFTMKLVKGQTLAALLSERTELAAERPRFLDIALKVAQTVAYAHAKGVIHRDLKPANIMVGNFGEVQVMDWGLAKVLAEGGLADEERANRDHQEREDVTTIRTARSSGSGVGTNTEAGSLLGTPAYMPPEQANGDIAHLDRRADVFGLGAILCEVLTGKPPYVGRSSEEVRRKAANGDLADANVRLDACGTDAELIKLTKSCLCPEAIDRPKDAQAVVEGLSDYLNGVQERLHQAELAHAAEVARTQEAQATAAQERKAKEAAQARALAERQARRLTLALAATVLLALTLGGGGWLWVKADRDARTAQVAREVNEALNKATALREQAKTATTGGAELFAQAREQASRALALVESGPADDVLKAEVQRLKAELDEQEKDRELIAALDEARLAQADTLAENRFASERAVPKFRTAFAAYGLPAGQGEPAAVAVRIRQRPAAVREAIVAALDEWDLLAGKADFGIEEPHRQWLRAVLDAADVDDWGRQVRAARGVEGPTQRRAVLEKLAASADVAKVPARALTLLAQQLRPSQAADLMRRAQHEHPADFWVNERLAWALRSMTPPETAEAVRFLTAAVALRPDSPGCLMNLGRMLQDAGQLDEAIACLQKVIALDPKYAVAHSNLGVALAAKGRVDEAIACHQKAIELDPNLAGAHSNLGVMLKAKGQLDEALACFQKAIALDPKEARAHHNLGVVLQAKGLWDGAIASYRKAILLAPKDTLSHIGLGTILCDVNHDYDAAIACFKKAVELDPKSASAHSDLGHALELRGRLEEALACHRRAIELDPKSAMAHIGLGAFFSDKKGDHDAAIACFKKAVEVDPKSAQAHSNLGVALYVKGQVDDAIASYRKAIELDPKFAHAYSMLGVALVQKDRTDQAIGTFQKALALDPKLVEAHYNLGIALQRKGRVDEAIACFQRAIELGAKAAAAHYKLGVALRDRGRVDEAIACFQRAIEIDPKDAMAHIDLGNALADKGRVGAAITCLKKAIEIDPKSVAAHAGLGVILCDLKRDFDGAIASFQKAIALEPKSVVIHFNLGNALGAKGRVDEAIASYQRAIALDPKLAPAHFNLGSALADKGEVDAAIACYRKVIALDPKHARAHYGLGLVLTQKGQLGAAIASFQKAIELQPKFAQAHCTLGIALQQDGRFAESLAAYQRGHELGTKQPGWSYPSARWVREAERLAALESKLPAYLKGEFQPRDTTERIDLIRVCHGKKLHAAAARLYADAVAESPKLADDPEAHHRYNAACDAALAAAGQGEDAARLGDEERARLRQQALGWLRAELVAYTKLMASGPPAARDDVLKRLQHWRRDSDLSGVRDAAALAKLPAEERAACEKLWADVANLLTKAEEKTK
jgi:serine/threonine-protein kinase